MDDRDALADFLGDGGEIVRVTLSRVQGSAPREVGASMLVSAAESLGTIGGGQLEFMALDAARRMLARGEAEARLDVPLGPEIGQCCGGRVEVLLTRLSPRNRDALVSGRAHDRWPHVLIFGAGHVGRALAGFCAQLPLHTVLIDSRADELDRCTAPVDRRLTALPEAEIAGAPPGSAFVVLTHDHALDFLLAAEALARGDAAYVGMIGSASKRAQFQRHLASMHPGLTANRLTCPIGAAGRPDKRPAVIAAFAATEIMGAVAACDRSAHGETERARPL